MKTVRVTAASSTAPTASGSRRKQAAPQPGGFSSLLAQRSPEPDHSEVQDQSLQDQAPGRDQPEAKNDPAETVASAAPPAAHDEGQPPPTDGTDLPQEAAGEPPTELVAQAMSADEVAVDDPTVVAAATQVDAEELAALGLSTLTPPLTIPLPAVPLAETGHSDLPGAPTTPVSGETLPPAGSINGGLSAIPTGPIPPAPEEVSAGQPLTMTPEPSTGELPTTPEPVTAEVTGTPGKPTQPTSQPFVPQRVLDASPTINEAADEGVTTSDLPPTPIRSPATGETVLHGASDQQPRSPSPARPTTVHSPTPQGLPMHTPDGVGPQLLRPSTPPSMDAPTAGMPLSGSQTFDADLITSRLAEAVARADARVTMSAGPQTPWLSVDEQLLMDEDGPLNHTSTLTDTESSSSRELQPYPTVAMNRFYRAYPGASLSRTMWGKTFSDTTRATLSALVNESLTPEVPVEDSREAGSRNARNAAATQTPGPSLTTETPGSTSMLPGSEPFVTRAQRALMGDSSLGQQSKHHQGGNRDGDDARKAFDFNQLGLSQAPADTQVDRTAEAEIIRRPAPRIWVEQLRSTIQKSSVTVGNEAIRTAIVDIPDKNVGRIRMELEMAGGKLTVHLGDVTPEVKALFESSFSDLKQQLSKHDIDLSGFTSGGKDEGKRKKDSTKDRHSSDGLSAGVPSQQTTIRRAAHDGQIDTVA